MPTLSPDIIQVLSIFTIGMTGPTFTKMLVLFQGTILTGGRRTITAALRAMGLSDEPAFSKYHQVFNRAKWSPWVLSKLLLALLIKSCVPPGAALVLLIDDTLERRQGPQIKYKGWFRDPIRSTVKHVSTSLGIRWLCVALAVTVPGASVPGPCPLSWCPPYRPKPARK